MRKKKISEKPNTNKMTSNNHHLKRLSIYIIHDDISKICK